MSSFRIELLDFLNALQNEVQQFEVDPECSAYEDGNIIDKMKATIAVLERLYPMIQPIDEILLGEISPKLFWAKWENVKGHFNFPDDDVEDEEIGEDVKGFLDKFGPQGDTA